MRADILNQIKTVVAFKAVGEIADLTAILHGQSKRTKKNLRNLPAAYLRLVGQNAGEAQTRSNSFTQTITYNYEVIIVARSRNDASGSLSAHAVDDLIDALDDALVAHVPQGADTPLVKSRNAGRLVQWQDDLYYYSAFYECTKRICKSFK